MGSYFPGQSVRLIVKITQLQMDGSYAPANASPLTIEIQSSDGTPQTAPAIVNDVTGTYHADFAIPILGKRGNWNVIWRTTSATPALNALQPTSFQVLPLPFAP